MASIGAFIIINIRWAVDFHCLSFQYLEELKNKKVRIIIGDMFDDVLRDVMCQAYHLKMTAREGYVWFLPLWLAPSWYDTDYYNVHRSENVPCTAAQMVDVSSFSYLAYYRLVVCLCYSSSLKPWHGITLFPRSLKYLAPHS